MIEEWRAVDGWPYEVSDQGRVRRAGGRQGTRVGRVLRPHLYASRRADSPYARVALKDAPRARYAFVHTLVLAAFVGPAPSSDHTCNHRNGRKLDNRPENLEWATRTENNQHAWATGLCVGRPTNIRIPPELIPGIRQRRAAGEKIKDLAVEFGVHVGTMSQLVRRKSWAHLP